MDSVLAVLVVVGLLAVCAGCLYLARRLRRGGPEAAAGRAAHDEARTRGLAAAEQLRMRGGGSGPGAPL